MQTKNGGFRFLFITADEFPPFRPDVEVLFGKEMLERGYEIDWIMRSSDPNQPAGCVTWRGCKAWLAATHPGGRPIDRLRKHLATLRNELRVFALAKSGQYDFIQVRDKFLAAIMALVAARKNRLKFFFWLSFPFPEASIALSKSPDSRYPRFYLLRGLVFKFILYRIVCPRADHVFVQSEEMRRVMSEKGVPYEKMTPVPMGVNMDAFPATDEAPSPAPSEPAQIVLYLGSLDKSRHLEFLLEVFAMVSDAHPRATLYFVGDSEEADARPFLEAEARRFHVSDRVLFTGFLPRDSALSYVRAAAVCVALTKADAMYAVASPTKLVEYLALRKPVLANTHPDQKQVIEASGGGLCVPWERSAFAEALAWLLDHPEEARAMGEAGREFVKRERTYSRIADNVDWQYRHLLLEANA